MEAQDLDELRNTKRPLMAHRRTLYDHCAFFNQKM